MKKSSPIIHDHLLEMYRIIDYGTLEEFIKWAKSYNIFQESKNKFYMDTCNRIKNRLDKEGLSYEIIKPE